MAVAAAHNLLCNRLVTTRITTHIPRRSCLADLAVAIVIAATAAACSSPATPTDPLSLSGSWKGTAQVGSVIDTITATMTQAGSAVTGTWYLVHVLNPALNDSGFISGQVTGATVTLTLNSSTPNTCPYRVNAIVTGSSFMSGNYTTVSCTAAVSGLLSLTKQ